MRRIKRKKVSYSVFGSGTPTKMKKCTKRRRNKTTDFKIEPVIAEYLNDYNIHKIDSVIKEKFKNQEKKIVLLKKELERVNLIIDYSEIETDITIASKKKKILLKKIDELNFFGTLEEYKYKTDYLICMYDKLKKKRKIRVFGESNIQVDKKIENERLSVINQYIDIAKKYHDINVSRINPITYNCVNCNSPIDDTMEECQCGYIIEGIITKNINRDNVVGSDKSSDRKKNFKMILKKYQGKDKNIPKEVYEKINHFISKYNLKKTDLNKKTLRRILKENSLSDYYNQLNSIYAEYSSKELIKIPYNIEKNIIRRHELIDEVYDRIKPKNRINSLNINYLLFFILKKEGIEVSKRDLEFLKTRDVEITHETIMEKICKILQETHPEMDWDFISIL